MKKAQADNELTILAANRTKEERPAGADVGKGGKPESTKNVYTEIIHSLMDKNRKRVVRYYCANSRCSTTFYDAATGYQCPACGSIGIISEYKNDTSLEDDTGKPVLGYLDTIGRLFCTGCTHRYGLTDEVSMVIYHDSDPYRDEHCDVCRLRLSEAGKHPD